MVRFVSAALLVFCLNGCVAFSQHEVRWTDETKQLTWPSPPDPPRIRYLRSIGDPAELRKEWGGGSQLLRWLTGEEETLYPFVSPYGIAADGAGRIWVADMGIRGIHMIDLAQRKVEYLFAAGDTILESPVGVAADVVNDRLYLSDSILKRVFVYSLKGRFIGERKVDDGFGRPAGLAVDRSGRLYVVDVVKRRVTLFSPQGEFLRHYTGQSSPDFAFHAPSNVAVDGGGRVYVTDTMQFRVEILDTDGKPLGIVGELGDGPGSFGRPRGVAVDGDGHLYVADALFNNLQLFDREGQLLLAFGAEGKEPGQFSLPAGICIDQMNRIYVVDPQNRRIQIFQYLDK